MYKRQIDLLILGFSLFLMCLITFVAFIGAAAYDEGTGGNRFLYEVYGLLRFPTHTMFAGFFYASSLRFVLGLLINAVFYAFVIERVWSVFRSKKKGSELVS